MSNEYTKTIILDDSSRAVALGATQVKHDLKNKLNESAIAQEDSGDTKTLALNLNEINEQYEVTAKIDDDVAGGLNGELSIDTYTGDGSTTTYSVSSDIQNLEVRKETDGGVVDYNEFVHPSEYTIDDANDEITFDTAPANNVEIKIINRESKESVKDKVLAIFKSQQQVTLDYGSETATGFLQQISINEQSDNDSSFYRIKTRLLISEDMDV